MWRPALQFVCEKVETPPPSLTSRASGNGSVGKRKEEVSRRRHLLCSCVKHSLSGSACSGTEEFLSVRQEPTEPLHGGQPGGDSACSHVEESTPELSTHAMCIQLSSCQRRQGSRQDVSMLTERVNAEPLPACTLPSLSSLFHPSQAHLCSSHASISLPLEDSLSSVSASHTLQFYTDYAQRDKLIPRKAVKSCFLSGNWDAGIAPIKVVVIPLRWRRDRKSKARAWSIDGNPAEQDIFPSL